MEKVQEQEHAAEVFENDIAMYLQMFCDEQGIEDMSKESQSRWNAAMMYIRRHVFSDNSILKMSKPLEGYINNNYNDNRNNVNYSNCNAYDIDKVNIVCDYYIYLCYMYDKEISIMGFSKLTGINQDTIHDWGNNINKLSTSGCDIYKKLLTEREESLVNKLASNKNPVAVIAILNKHFGYNMPGVRQENERRMVLPMNELPKLSLSDDSSSNCTTEISDNMFDKTAENQ